MRLFSVFSRVAGGSPLPDPLKLTCHSTATPRGRRREGALEKSQNRYWLHPAARAPAKTLYNTALTDGHLILTVVFPQMEMFFLLPALRCDEVVGPLFVTCAHVLRMSCSFTHSTFEWDCFDSSACFRLYFFCSGRLWNCFFVISAIKSNLCKRRWYWYTDVACLIVASFDCQYLSRQCSAYFI